ncbi:glycoside hydrolase family 28 protein [Pedobacter sp. R20-19]|uniref:glycoside hydrolase family 28 protein n=1 Tax=Pedobacter sp. R20-19 TaxID=1270196 RepID=UPI0004932907|nr:glycosyl hydrolase family 28 protein [Pedobacter sp. R20-19]
MIKNTLLLIALLWSATAVHAQKNFNIIQYGAKVGMDNNAIFIQKAIDEASTMGGGKVTIPEGNFVTGPLTLKNNVELHLVKGAVLLGSTMRKDYTPERMAVISAYGQKNIAITGKGIINGQAHELMFNMFELLRKGELQDTQYLAKRPREENRPNLIFFKGCQGVRVIGITLKDAASWVQNYKECNNVVIDSMTVLSTAYWNNDAIDIVDSKKVRITNSYFNAADDAICLKSEIKDGFCEDVWIENCIMRSSANGFKIGTASLGGFRNITAKNLTVFDTYRSAVAIEAVDGGFLENIKVTNVRGKNTGNAVFIRLGHRNQDERYSSIKNVWIEDVKVEVPAGKPDIGYPLEGPAPKVAAHNLVPASITGLPGHLVENVTLKDIEISYGGGATKSKAYHSIDSLSTVTENAAGYPEFTMFGELPSWGLYVRHAKDIKLINVKISLKAADFRPAMIFDDVSGLKLNDLSIPEDAVLPVIVYRNTNQLSTSGLKIPKAAEATVIKK